MRTKKEHIWARSGNLTVSYISSNPDVRGRPLCPHCAAPLEKKEPIVYLHVIGEYPRRYHYSCFQEVQHAINGVMRKAQRQRRTK